MGVFALCVCVWDSDWVSVPRLVSDSDTFRRRQCRAARSPAGQTPWWSSWASSWFPPGERNTKIKKSRMWWRDFENGTKCKKKINTFQQVCQASVKSAAMSLTLCVASFLISSCSLFRIWRFGLFFLAYCWSSITLLSEFSCKISEVWNGMKINWILNRDSKVQKTKRKQEK